MRFIGRPTLPGVLVGLVVDKVAHAAAVVQPLLVVKGLERLAGAVGLLSGHAALVRLRGGRVELRVFGAAAPGEGAMAVVLQVHAAVGTVHVRLSVCACVRACARAG